MDVIEPSPIIPSDEMGKTVFSNVSELINFIFFGSIYSIKNTLLFNISFVGSVIKIISPNFNNISLLELLSISALLLFSSDGIESEYKNFSLFISKLIV